MVILKKTTCFAGVLLILCSSGYAKTVNMDFGEIALRNTRVVLAESQLSSDLTVTNPSMVWNKSVCYALSYPGPLLKLNGALSLRIKPLSSAAVITDYEGGYRTAGNADDEGKVAVHFWNTSATNAGTRCTLKAGTVIQLIYTGGRDFSVDKMVVTPLSVYSNGMPVTPTSYDTLTVSTHEAKLP